MTGAALREVRDATVSDGEVVPPGVGGADRGPGPRRYYDDEARHADGAGGLWRRTKHLILRALKFVGLQDVVRDSQWRRQRLLVLCYHGVSAHDQHEWNPELYMPRALFRRRLELLRDGGYTVLSLDEGVERLRRGDLPPRSVVLTFDDGASDFYSEALPLLREFGFPATVYLTTYYCHFNRPVFDVTLPYLLWRGRDRTLSRDLVGAAGEWRLSEPAQREAARVAIRAHITTADRGGEAKDALLREIATRLGVDYDDIREKRILHLMTEAEVAEAASQGVSFQLHTHHHRTPRDVAAFTSEIEVNRAQIAELTGHATEPWHFCFPNGWHAPEFHPWLRSLGVRSATTCQPGMASRATEPTLIPRLVDTTAMSELEFEAWLSGIAAFLPRRRVATEDDGEN